MLKQAPRHKVLNIIVGASSLRRFTQGDDIEYIWNKFLRGRQIRLNVMENNLFAVIERIETEA
jgi:hypothetical protein